MLSCLTYIIICCIFPLFIFSVYHYTRLFAFVNSYFMIFSNILCAYNKYHFQTCFYSESEFYTFAAICRIVSSRRCTRTAFPYAVTMERNQNQTAHAAVLFNTAAWARSLLNIPVFMGSAFLFLKDPYFLCLKERSML